MSRQRVSNRRLPPLLCVSPVRVRTPTPKSGKPVSSATSYYHRNCCIPSRQSSPGPGAYLSVYARRSPMPRTPKTSKSQRLNSVKPSSALRPKRVEEFLDNHGAFLEDYILNKVDLDLLERWIIRKTQRECKLAMKTSQSSAEDTPERPSLSRWKFCVHADKRQMLQDLTNTLYNTPTKAHVLTELARTVASSVNATSWTLYIYDGDSRELYNFVPEENENFEDSVHASAVESGTTLACYVARTKEAIRIKTTENDLRFPDGVPVSTDSATFVLCHPILQPDGELSGVLELYRSEVGPEFHEEDEEIVKSYLVWGGIALHYSELYGDMTKQKELNTFLLSVVKSIFQDMISMDTLIIKIMVFARKLVNADRASLFLVDGHSRELFARMFDVSGQDGESEDTEFRAAREIRFPIGKGIAGYVAMTGESLSIKDAYNDDRFNRSIDQQTGYITRNLLCMPIFIRGSVIGVVQMVNKISGHFTKDDEEAFATFAIYCGLALHHAKLYDKIRRSEQKYKVALEILSYHNTSNTEELEAVRKLELPVDTDTLKEFYFAPSHLNSDEKVVAAIYMINDLFLNKSSILMDEDTLARFTLTVRKNYRRVPYHNWAHGFTVANSMYSILKQCTGFFTPLEELAQYVACLCHDLDHRGKTNQFLAINASPLAAIYTTSTLEHHHFNMTISILQQEGHNILKNLSSAEYKQVLNNIKHCILATDLALFFPNKAKLSEIVKTDSFDWNFIEHRKLLQAVVMTGCDLCASTKAWDQQTETVKVIFEEFYDQGDAEKAQGRTPIPMMDRSMQNEQPSSQVGFLEGICIPCYELMYSLLPQSKSLLDQCKGNLEKWKNLVVVSKDEGSSEAAEDNNDPEDAETLE